jgi:hypothetical protein
MRHDESPVPKHRVLVMEYMDGSSAGDDSLLRLPQEDLNEVRFPRPYCPARVAQSQYRYRDIRRLRRR